MFPHTCINLDNIIYVKYIDAWKILNVPQNSNQQNVLCNN